MSAATTERELSKSLPNIQILSKRSKVRECIHLIQLFIFQWVCGTLCRRSQLRSKRPQTRQSTMPIPSSSWAYDTQHYPIVCIYDLSHQHFLSHTFANITANLLLSHPPIPVVLPPKWPTGRCHQHSEGSWPFTLQLSPDMFTYLMTSNVFDTCRIDVLSLTHQMLFTNEVSS